jgi:hypothetical protein
MALVAISTLICFLALVKMFSFGLESENLKRMMLTVNTTMEFFLNNLYLAPFNQTLLNKFG